jgi:branched-chain amino acid transport system ATP-binding protein
MNKPLLQVSGLNTYYGASHVLRDVDFKIAPGQTVGLMGRNGMGKSTLLKSITGLLKPKSGRIEFQDTAIHTQTPSDIAMLGMAYVPEGRGIFGNLSVHENLVMAERAGVRGQKDWTYQRVLDTFPRLAERLQQQMLSIGRALMTNPDLLLLDEATEGLAPLIAQDIWRICELVSKSGISTVIVDKNWQHVTRITQRNLILVKGEVVFEGSSAELLAQPELLKQHLGV